MQRVFKKSIKKNKKLMAFTLIELLAVIVILAIIALIVVPIILGLIEKSKYNAFKQTAYFTLDSYNYYVISEKAKGNLDYQTDMDVSELPLDNKDRLSGSVIKNENGDIELKNLTDGKYCANGARETLIITKGKCGSKEILTPSQPAPDDTLGLKGIMYYNPKIGKKCSIEQYNRDLQYYKTTYKINVPTGQKDGCMKWYIYDDTGDTYKMILDHNTTAIIDVFGKRLAEKLNDINLQYITDTKAWIAIRKENKRSITAQEIAKITGNKKWTSTGTSFDLDSNSYDQIANRKESSKYYWLFDYTYDCTSFGCKVKDSNEYTVCLPDDDSSSEVCHDDYSFGYWTQTPSGLEYVWRIFNMAYLGDYTGMHGASAMSGIRPVIEIPKTANSLIEVYYNPNKGETCTEREYNTNLEKYKKKASLNTPTGLKEGCMKWYLYDKNDNYDYMILDHNTSAGASLSGYQLDDKLYEDTKQWSSTIEEKRLITSDEIAKITGNITFENNSATSNDNFYFDSKTQESVVNSKGDSSFDWLFDYTNDCFKYGCSVEDSLTNGYWTASYKPNTGYRWQVSNSGMLNYSSANGENIGIRPVIKLATFKTKANINKVTDKSITVTVDTIVGNPTNYKYEISKYDEIEDDFVIFKSINSKEQVYTFEDLQRETEYSITITVTNDDGATSISKLNATTLLYNDIEFEVTDPDKLTQEKIVTIKYPDISGTKGTNYTYYLSGAKISLAQDCWYNRNWDDIEGDWVDVEECYPSEDFEYAINGDILTTNPTELIVISNGSIIASIIDESGDTIFSKTLTITNIDDENPIISDVKEIGEIGDKKIVITATDTLSGLHDKAYKCGDSDWQASNVCIFTKYGIQEIKVRDKLENVSSKEITLLSGLEDIEFEVTDPDKLTKEKKVTINYPDLSGVYYKYSINGNVRCSDDDYYEYSTGNDCDYNFDDGEFDATNPKVLTIYYPNFSILAKVLDKNKKLLLSKIITITNIDGENPIISEVKEIGDKKIEIIATDNLSGIHERAYKCENNDWQESNICAFDEEGIYTIRVRDKVGNVKAKTVVIGDIKFEITDSDKSSKEKTVTINYPISKLRDVQYEYSIADDNGDWESTLNTNSVEIKVGSNVTIVAKISTWEEGLIASKVLSITNT